VRQAAFQLAERLNDSQVLNLLLDYAKGPEPRLAVEALECLGRLKSAAAVNGIISLLGSSKKKWQLVACCRALGMIAEPASIEPLAKILGRKGFFSRKRTAEVRATAIIALTQISHPQAAKVLAVYVDDRDPRVQEIARIHVRSGKSPADNSPVK